MTANKFRKVLSEGSADDITSYGEIWSQVTPSPMSNISPNGGVGKSYFVDAFKGESMVKGRTPTSAVGATGERKPLMQNA